MLPILQLGPLAVPVPEFILLAGFWIGASLSERLAPRSKLNSELVGNLILFSLVAAILGARLSYALQYPGAFLQAPLSLISLDANLLDPAGGLAVGALFALVYSQRHELPLWPTLDALTPFLAVMAFSIALANFASGAAYGLPSNLPWAIDLWGARRHPSQLYEALAAALILWDVLRAPADRPSGVAFLCFAGLSAAALLFLGAFRADGAVLPNGWRLAQIGAWLALAAVVWLVRRREQIQKER